MSKNKLSRTLQAFKSSEINGLEAALQSVLFNNENNAKQLSEFFNLMKARNFDFDDENIQEEVFKKMYPNKAVSLMEVAKLRTGLQKVAEKYVVYKKYCVESSESTQNLAIAEFYREHYHEIGDFSQAQDALSQTTTSFDDLQYGTNMYRLQIKIYYDKGESELFESFTGRFKNYLHLRNGKTISQGIYLSNNNFNNKIARIAKLREELPLVSVKKADIYKIELDKMAKDIRNDKSIAERDWLLKSIETLIVN